jgi:dTDP-4-amino-4,6-dideoxygalactose transaminase
VVRHDKRDALQAKLGEMGVGSLIHYPVAAHLAGAYADMKLGRGSFPIAEKLADTVLSLPIGPHLESAQSDEVLKRAIVAANEVA